ncbi:AzlC family ABC transporter permease [Lentilactobacillus sp. Marseille-Q4993]|uniref:AzlC family ABC transporter permease n=1 Tax=Lentilactobacillus sp. Marseille-Q4993 TaxID=3039492 RepID=UPI0024BC3CC4|nr:AzlC family ABC transporter permease [Lentilactobacillus sp. Marseille-Q4993]
MAKETAKLEAQKPYWRRILDVSLPVDLSYIPIGLACGILLHASGFNIYMTALVSILVFSGGAQFLIASLLATNAPMFSVVLMLFFLELRYALLGSSLSKYLHGRSLGFTALFAASMNDENYAINYLKFSTDKKFTPRDALNVEHYTLAFWTVSNIIGSVIGSAIKIDLTVVHFALTALFLYMIVMQLKNGLIMLICVISAFLAAYFMVLTKSTLGLVISTLIASFIGFSIEALIRKYAPANGLLRNIKNPAGSPKDAEEE